jgi:hypothetical protein
MPGGLKGAVRRLWGRAEERGDPVGAATEQLRQRCALLTARRRRPGQGGSSNLYTEVIKSGGQRYFLKAVKPGQDRELRFYSALLGGMVRHEDEHYLIPTPLLITQTEHSTTYLFPYYSVDTLNRPAFLQQPGWRLLRGVAAFNAAHPATAELRGCFESARFAPDLNHHKLNQAFGAHPKAQVDALFRDIVLCCDQVREQLAGLGLDSDSPDGSGQLALAMNDFNCENAGFTNNAGQRRIVLMDMGRAQLAPLGHDLRWHFHYICQLQLEISSIDEVVAIYATALGEHGLQIEPRALAVAGLAGYVDNWFSQRCLLPSARAPVEQKWQRLQLKIAFVRACLQQLER